MRSADLAVILAALAFGPAVASAEEGDDAGAAELDGTEGRPGSVVEEAQRVLAVARATSYSHRTHIDEEGRAFDVDCSGFAGYLLRRAAPAARRELIAATVKRPLARDFVGFLDRLPGGVKRGHWRRVARARDLAPGDLIAWLRPADSHSNDTGHVMIVVAAPAALADAEVAVAVIDSSGLPHGKSDRRAAGAKTGVGSGTVVLRVDEAGRPVGFRWAVGRGYKGHETEVVLGRVEP